MVRVFQRSGGLAGCEEVLSRLEGRCSRPISVLARRIVAQEVVTFEWHGRWLLPKFQFDPADMSVLPAVAAVLAELRGIVEDWELAAWFAEPSEWLQGATPVQALGSDLQSVLAAARVERFIAKF